MSSNFDRFKAITVEVLAVDEGKVAPEATFGEEGVCPGEGRRGVLMAGES
jgi:hypothetical protein